MNSAVSLLLTKLHCPRPAEGLVQRQRLFDLLAQSLQLPLTLVSAPPGYGKTALVSSWLHARELATAWLVLDEGEGSLAQFLAYLIASLEQTGKGKFKASTELLATSDLPPLSLIATVLANDIESMGKDIVLVLDDYHSVDYSSTVHELMGRLLEHPPQNLHIILLTRRDPPFPLNRMRACSQILDIRMSDLRFRADETAAMLEQSLGKPVGPAAIHNLQSVLEGWGAALRMASLAIQRADGADRLLENLSGSVQQIQEYLFEEVLASIDDTLLRYVVSGALANRFSAGLLDVMVSGLLGEEAPHDGKTFIDNAVHSNMFIISLDSHGEWYRYHNLFRELLLQKGKSVFGEARLRRAVEAACKWLEGQGHYDDAIRLLIDSELYHQAAQVVERHRMDLLDEDQWLVLDNWIQHFPARQSADLAPVLLARAAMATFRLDVSLVEHLVRQLDALHGRAALTESQLSEQNYFRALPLFWSGHIETATQMLEEAVAGSTRGRQLEGEMQVYLAVARAMTGEAGLALDELAKREVANAGRRDTLASRLAAARSYVSFISLDTNPTLQAAESLLSMGEEEPRSLHALGWGYYMKTLVLLHTGRYESARLAARAGLECRYHVERRLATELLLAWALCATYLDDAASVELALAGLQAVIDNSSEVSSDPVLARSSIARIRLLRGEKRQAEKLGRELPHQSDAGTLVFWLEEPAVTWLKLQLLSERPVISSTALAELSRLLELARAQRLCNWVIELLLLKAIACSVDGKMTEAAAHVHEAVQLAVPAAWVGPFIELSQALKRLVPDLALQEESAVFLQRALYSSRDPSPERVDVSSMSASAGTAGGCANDLRSAFTHRELDILELLAGRYRNKEIAARLYISSHTVNYHLKHIYQKLQVSSRRMAVIRAGELGILSDTA